MAKKDLIYSNQQSMFGAKEIIGFGCDEFYIKEMDRNKAIEVIIKNHYSKKVFNNSYIHLGCYINNELLGVLQFGHLLNNLSVGTLVEGTNSVGIVRGNLGFCLCNVSRCNFIPFERGMLVT